MLISALIIFFVAGLLIGLIYHSNIYGFFRWLSVSFEEANSKASSTRLTGFLFSIVFTVISIHIINKPSWEVDYQPNQMKLLELTLDNLVYLILFLFLYKEISKSTVLGSFLNRFGKGGGNGSNDNNGNTSSASESAKEPSGDPSADTGKKDDPKKSNT